MIEKRTGVIINTASVGAIAPRPGMTAYNATKGAVDRHAITVIGKARHGAVVETQARVWPKSEGAGNGCVRSGRVLCEGAVDEPRSSIATPAG